MAVTQLEFIVEPSDSQAGRNIVPAIQVALKDETGSIVTTATDEVTIEIEDNPGAGVLSGVVTKRASAGVASFNNLKIDSPGVDYTLRASVDIAEEIESPSDLGEIWDWWEPSREVGLSNGSGMPTLTGQKNGRNWSQANSASRPVFDTGSALNGHAVATFNGGLFFNGPNMTTIPTGFGHDKQGHIFIVVRCDNDPALDRNDAGLWKMSSTSDGALFVDIDGHLYESALKTSRDHVGDPATDLTSFRVYEVRAVGSLGSGQQNGTYVIRLDGDEYLTNQEGDAIVSIDFIASPLLGKNATGHGFKGSVAGIYLATPNLVNSSRSQLISYLNSRFALAAN